MNRIQDYYNAYCGHRAALRAAWDAYNKGVQALEPYKGSAGYSDSVNQLRDKREAAITAARVKYANEFNSAVSGMRASIDGIVMPAVTDEQMNVLAVLKMRNKVTRDEVKQAARAVADNPVALGVVYEVAETNGFHSLRGVIGGESADSARRCIDKLAASARELIALDKVDARKERGINAMREISQGGSGVNALRGYRVDADIDSAGEAMHFFGDVEDITSFSGFVNRRLVKTQADG